MVNASVYAAAPRSPFLRACADSEAEQIAVVQDLAPRLAIVPLLAHEVVGEGQLTALVEGGPGS